MEGAPDLRVLGQVSARIAGINNPLDIKHIRRILKSGSTEQVTALLAEHGPEVAALLAAAQEVEKTNSMGRPLGETAIAIRAEVTKLTSEFDRMTVRQIFYKLSTRNVIAKTEAGYRQVQKQVLQMRLDGDLSWSFVTDGTRWQRKPDSFDRVTEYVNGFARGYRRNLWQSQDVRVEVWLEKDALADVIADVCHDWDVSLMVSRGQSSATFLHSAGQEAHGAWVGYEAETHIFALYDYDAGGARAAKAVATDLPEYAEGAPVHFTRLAVTPEQIVKWQLPMRPPKRTDPQAEEWGNKPAVELDAIDPVQLNELVENAITGLVDHRAWEIQKRIERSEREGLAKIADTLKDDK